MGITTVTSREFNQDLAAAKRAAVLGPVFVTDRGRPSLVLVTYEQWASLAGNARSIADVLAGSLGAAEVEFDVVPDRAIARAAEFD